MQQRFHVSWAPTFSDAVLAKQTALIGGPDTNFQIRRRKERFELVKRLTYKEAQAAVNLGPGYFDPVNTSFHKKRKKSKKVRRQYNESVTAI